MPQRVLDVGQCLPDHQTITRFLQTHFDVEVFAADDLDDALRVIERGGVDLVLVNRILDCDSSPGLELIRALQQQQSAAARVPVMLVSNYADAQKQATGAGAWPGFGKQQLGDPETVSRLAHVLGENGRSRRSPLAR